MEVKKESPAEPDKTKEYRGPASKVETGTMTPNEDRLP